MPFDEAPGGLMTLHQLSVELFISGGKPIGAAFYRITHPVPWK
jgi:hypothetical protein